MKQTLLPQLIRQNRSAATPTIHTNRTPGRAAAIPHIENRVGGTLLSRKPARQEYLAYPVGNRFPPGIASRSGFRLYSLATAALLSTAGGEGAPHGLGWVGPRTTGNACTFS